MAILTYGSITIFYGGYCHFPKILTTPKKRGSQEVDMHIVICSSQLLCPIYAVQAWLLPLPRLRSTPIPCTYTLSAGISKAHLPKFCTKHLDTYGETFKHGCFGSQNRRIPQRGPQIQNLGEIKDGGAERDILQMRASIPVKPSHGSSSCCKSRGSLLQHQAISTLGRQPLSPGRKCHLRNFKYPG